MPRGRSKKKPKETPEPATFLCKGPETVIEHTPLILGTCVQCNIYPANSATDSLCLDCHKRKEGYIFDEEQKLYIKEEKHGRRKQ